MEKKKLFGTDGIRGEFGEWPLTEEVVYNVSLAISKWLKKKHDKTLRVIIGKDTRKSCPKIEKILASGFKKAGVKVYSAGVIPTPGLAYLANTMDVELGVMISASHNPWEDNGIKFFKHNGFKLSEKEEKAIERITFPMLESGKANPSGIKIKTEKINPKAYLGHLKSCVNNMDLRGMKIVADCANGASSAYAFKLFSELGAMVIILNNRPDGKNINLNCGSLHPEVMAKAIRKNKADIGFSFDGDADRVIFGDEKGNVLDGDFIMALVARVWLKDKKLKNKIVVGTSMTNFGLEKFLKNLGVTLIRADVGDKYVLSDMQKKKAVFGGEQSGHMIFLEHATTGDGLLTALKLLEIICVLNKKVSLLVKGLKKYPQLISNVRVKEKKDFKKMPAVWEKIQKAEKHLSGKGRLVMRYSGTEQLARVMVEAQSKSETKKIAADISNAIAREIGV